MKFMSLMNKAFKQKEDGKKNYAFMLLVAGALAILISTLFSSGDKPKTDEKKAQIGEIREAEEKRLEKILCNLDGIKSVKVLISYENSGTLEALTEERVVEKRSMGTDKTGGNEMQTEKKPVFDGSKSIVAKTENMPEIKGVCIFYTGAYDEKTEDKLYRAAKSSLGAELHKIEVVHSEK